MNIFSAQKIHFTGIKGVGMTSLALCALDLGKSISGSDVAEVFETDHTLSQRGIQVSIGFSPENISPKTDLVIYTGAHNGPQNPQVVAAKKAGIEIQTHAQALGSLFEGKLGVSVAGVGGKTTTAAMISTVLENAVKTSSHAIGVASISSLNSPGKYDLTGRFFIAEADEYATAPGHDNTPRFMHQTPQIIACTNILHDHPDVYPTLNDNIRAFTHFFEKLPNNGTLIINGDDPNCIAAAGAVDTETISVGRKDTCSVKLLDVATENQTQLVSFEHNQKKFEFKLSVPGEFNVMNALMAYIVCQKLGLGSEAIQTGLFKFKGTHRRFQNKGTNKGALLYDDYAHHPSEIKATLHAAKQWLPENRIVAIFQPHTYSRTKALLEDFRASFVDADKVIITNIFPSAREKPDPSITGEMLAQKISQDHPDTTFVPQEDLVKYINKVMQPKDALFTIGAGDVYKFHSQFTEFKG